MWSVHGAGCSNEIINSRRGGGFRVLQINVEGLWSGCKVPTMLVKRWIAREVNIQVSMISLSGSVRSAGSLESI
jgi:hypothetical protein